MLVRLTNLFRTGSLQLPALLAVLFSICLIRACIQSITIDEADTFLVWAARAEPSHWQAGSNNHVLNSLLIRFSTTAFGVSHLSLRLPALLGALLFMLTTASLARQLFATWRGQCVFFIAIAANPLVMDYMVASRGYGLALAFLAGQFLVLFHIDRTRDEEPPLRPPGLAAIASLLAALAFSSNFSFAIISGVTWLFSLSLLCLHGPAGNHVAPEAYWKNRLRIAFWGIMPGAVLASALCASVLADWKQIELIYGATSLREMLASVLDSSFHPLNPHLVNPVFYDLVSAFPRPLLWLILAAAALQGVWLLFHRPAHPDNRTKSLRRFACITASALLAALLLHTGMHLAWETLLPRERTAIYIPFLLTLAIGSLAAAGPVSPHLAARILNRCLRGGLVAAALLFILCGRLTYFKEWQYDADVEAAYRVLTLSVPDPAFNNVYAHWRYTSSLNFYAWSPRDRVTERFRYLHPYPDGGAAYILYWPEDEEFARAAGLKVVYTGAQSDIVVALPPRPAPPVAH